MNVKKPMTALRWVAINLSLAHFFGVSKTPNAKKGAKPAPPIRGGSNSNSTTKPATAHAAPASGSDFRSDPLAAGSLPQDEDAEMRGDGPIAAARNRERARCQAIMSCDAAAKNPQLAALLAFKDRMPRKEAIALLETMPATVSTDPRNLARAARNPRVGAGGEVHSSPQQAAVTRMSAAVAAESKKATGERR